MLIQIRDFTNFGGFFSENLNFEYARLHNLLLIWNRSQL